MIQGTEYFQHWYIKMVIDLNKEFPKSDLNAFPSGEVGQAPERGGRPNRAGRIGSALAWEMSRSAPGFAGGGPKNTNDISFSDKREPLIYDVILGEVTFFLGSE